jgi:hypothetical protein
LDLLGVTFGNGGFVAVGKQGTILTSLDGVSWATQSSGVFAELRSVTYGNGIYIAVEGRQDELWNYIGGRTIRSQDGISWTEGSTDFWDLRGVTFGNGVFVTVGSTCTHYSEHVCLREIPRIFTSMDGENWNQRLEGTFEVSDAYSKILLDVTFGNGTFVAVGTGCMTYTSTDGIIWNLQDSVCNVHLAGITYGIRGFVAVGESGTILQSDLFLFGDIALGHWAEGFITALYDSGISAGCGRGNYCPDDPITRGQMAVFLVTSLGQSPVQCTGRFGDVPIGHPFCGFIEKLFDLGITGGCSLTDGTFCPDDPVTRGQMAVFIEASLGNAGNECLGLFGDIPVGTPFCGFIERLWEDGITGGCSVENFCYNDPVTRAQMAVFLVAAPPPLNP